VIATSEPIGLFQLMEQTHHKYFVGHKKPEFPIWENFSFYEVPSTNSSQAGSVSSIYTNHTIFNEYASLFHLARTFDHSKNLDELITICQYRRFVFNKKIGKQSVTMPWCRVLTHDEITTLNVTNDYLPLPGNAYLVGSAIHMPSILQQYAEAHFVRDILRFTSTLIDLGIFNNQDAFNFLNSQYLIPSPSCGTFTLRAFLTIFETLEAAATGFWNDGYKPYDDRYQCRVISFLLERLNSFLLISYLNKNLVNINNSLGYTTMVTPENSDATDVQRGLV
jgi:hypothetical protein